MARQSRSVLVVEDQEDIREVIVDILEENGWAVTTANHGEEALAHLASMPAPSVILLDRLMPVLSGADFLARLRGSDRWNGIPVIEMSASDPKPSPGVSGLLRKPFTIEELLAALEPFAAREPSAA
jgi:CheY-like chemotaxis protein